MLPSEEVEDGQTNLSVFMRKEGDDMAAVYLEIDASQLAFAHDWMSADRNAIAHSFYHLNGGFKILQDG